MTDELDTVTDAFVRINSQGKRMTEAHMLRALTHLDTIDTDQRFAEVRGRLETLGWGELDDQILVNVLKCLLELDVYGSDVRHLRNHLKLDPRLLDDLGDAMEEAVAALVDIGVRGPSALPYAYQLVAMAAIAAREPGRLAEPAVQKRLRRWFWITTYTEHFTGITGNGIRESIEDLVLALYLDEPYRPLTHGGPLAEPLAELRMPSVRGRAFLLFLAQLPGDPAARRRRQALLASNDARFIARLFPKSLGEDPANRVIADAEEVRVLRDALQGGPRLRILSKIKFHFPRHLGVIV